MFGSTTDGARTNPANTHKHAAELVALAPDRILAGGAATIGPLFQAIRRVPIVFVNIANRLALVSSRDWRDRAGTSRFHCARLRLQHQMVKEIARGVTRAAVIRDQKPTAAPRLSNRRMKPIVRAEG
jgi:hypothetical protein